MSRSLKIKPNFLKHKSLRNPQQVNSLLFDVFSSVHIFAGIGETFTNLTKLTIGRYEGSVEFLEREDFAHMKQLKELDIFKNPIRSIDEDVFWDLTSLEILSIFQAQLQALPENLLINLKMLKEVWFQGNQLKHVDKDLFRNNQQLEIVVFEDNKISSIKADFTKLSNLKEVNFLGNVCTKLLFLLENSQQSVQKLQAAINRSC